MVRRTGLSRRRAAAFLLAAATLAVSVPPGTARAQAPASEAEAKVKFALTLARFVQWPAASLPAASATLRLCVVHNSPALATAFGVQQGVLVAGRPVSVALNPAAHPNACDLLFVDGSASRAAAGALADSVGPATLTLGAVDGFLSQGGMVELVNVDDALRFDVNLKALRSAQLGLSAHVLKLARQVRE